MSSRRSARPGRRKLQRGSGGGFILMLIEFLSDGNSAGEKLVGRDTNRGKLTGQRFGGNEIAVHIAQLCIRITGVIRCDEETGKGNVPYTAKLGHHHAGENMNTDRRVVMPFFQLCFQLGSTQSQKLIQHGAFVRPHFLFFKCAVANVPKLGGIFVEPCMPVADKF